MAKRRKTAAPAQISAPVQRGRPFPKGVSGNPGGRPKAISELHAGLLAMSPDAMKAMGECLRGPSTEQKEENLGDYMWFRALAKERVAALKVWFEFTLPKPHLLGPELPKPVPLPRAEEITTLAMLDEVRQMVANEIAKLKAYGDQGLPVDAARLTECVKQMGALVEHEAKLLEADDLADKSETELKKIAGVKAANED